jgi:YD repeat-containing protein
VAYCLAAINKTVTFFDGTTGTTYSYDYDAKGNRTLEMGSTHERHLVYDELNRLKQVTDTTLGKVIDYTYDPAGNRSTMTADGLRTSYRYDKANRVIEVNDPDGGATRLTYDLAGNRKTVRYPNGWRATGMIRQTDSRASSTRAPKGRCFRASATYSTPWATARARPSRTGASSSMATM